MGNCCTDEEVIIVTEVDEKTLQDNEMMRRKRYELKRKKETQSYLDRVNFQPELDRIKKVKDRVARRHQEHMMSLRDNERKRYELERIKNIEDYVARRQQEQDAFSTVIRCAVVAYE